MHTLRDASQPPNIARKDGRVDWLETSDEFVGGMVELRYEVRENRGVSPNSILA